MQVYQGRSKKRRLSAFVNTGGSYANMGTSSDVLKLRPGVNIGVSLPPEDERGVIFEMDFLDIPVIHLLYIKGLALKYGLPWDPIPLPNAGPVRTDSPKK